MKFYLFRKKIYSPEEISNLNLNVGIFNELKIIDLTNVKNLYATCFFLNEFQISLLGSISLKTLEKVYFKNLKEQTKSIKLDEINFASIYSNLNLFGNKFKGNRNLYVNFIKLLVTEKALHAFDDFEAFKIDLSQETFLFQYDNQEHQKFLLQKHLDFLLERKENLISELKDLENDIYYCQKKMSC